MRKTMTRTLIAVLAAVMLSISPTKADPVSAFLLGVGAGFTGAFGATVAGGVVVAGASWGAGAAVGAFLPRQNRPVTRK